MLRSIQPLARRSFSAAAQASPSATSTPTPSSSASTTAAPTTSQPPPPSATPPPPPPPPPQRASLMLRLLPLATVSGAGYVAYRASVDDEFRTTITTTVPQLKSVIDRIPAPPPASSDPSASASSSPSSSSPILQLRISDPTPFASESEPSTSSPDSTEAASPKASDAAESKSGDSVSTSDPPRQQLARDPEPVAKPSTGDPISATTPSPPPSIQTPRPSPMPPAQESSSASASSSESASDPSRRSMSGKEKIARLIGKGDFRADQVAGKDVVSDAEFRRPSAWSNSSPSSEGATTSAPPPSTTVPESCPIRRPPATAVPRAPSSTSPPALPPARNSPPIPASSSAVSASPVKSITASTSQSSSAPDTVSAVTSGADSQVEALRAELAGQARWEAVRLQEAVTAQRVASTKEAAREAGEVARRHASELEQTRETAAKDMQVAVEERGRAVEKRMLAEREEAVNAAIVRREGELRDVARADAAEAAAAAAHGRETTVKALTARVEALDAHFGRVVDAGLALREAGQRAAAAFILRDAVAAGGPEPLGDALKAAGGAGEVGKLAAAAVPESAVTGGVATLRGLENDFGTASRRGLAAAAVPEQHAGSMWAHALGAVFSRLKLPVDVRLDADGKPRNDEERIRLARELVREGSLDDAVRTLDGLSGLSKEVMSDWVGKAKARLAANMAAEVMTAEAIVSQVGVAAPGRS